MIINVDKSLFVQSFVDFNRFDQFGTLALEKLFDYYEEFEECTNTPIECDVIAICCEWSRYENDQDLLIDYGYLVDDVYFLEDVEDPDHCNIAALLEKLRERTQVIEYDGKKCKGYLVQEF